MNDLLYSGIIQYYPLNMNGGDNVVFDWLSPLPRLLFSSFVFERDLDFGAIGDDLAFFQLRKSRNDCEARSTAAAAAFSQDSVLVPINVITL
jgi:hypothetical protein